MAWTTPPTFSNGAVLTAAQLDILANDMDETAPGKATSEGTYFVATGVNAIAERQPKTDTDTAEGTTTSATFGNLTGADTGPAVTVATGKKAVVGFMAHMAHSGAGAFGRIGYAVSGATTDAAANARSLQYEPGVADRAMRRSYVTLHEGLTDGNNTFTMKYSTTSATFTVKHRHLWVLPF